ncbi:tectonic-1-like [Megalops cyprinoides]|uniref:tectonic-1-like n=1 Tax=Megalops cyprinoides TaxID=118141 RepID=UPI0018654434|nr:tectonic-1-like [Megalops cyprinoides]
MDVWLWICVFSCSGNAILNANAKISYFNSTTASDNESVTDINALFNNTRPEDASTASLPVTPETLPDASTTGYPGITGPPEVGTEIFTTTDVNSSPETTTTITHTTPSISGSQPLPLSGSLPPPVTDVSRLCPCNLLEGQCDVNCCCDRDCVGDFKLFTSCSVEKLVADPQLCSQDTVQYSLSTTADGWARVQTSVTQEVNPNILCIQRANYKAGLSFGTPEVPTDGNFDGLFQQFAGFSFASIGDGGTLNQVALQVSPGYMYADVIWTQEESGERGFFRLPAPAGTAHCSDANPAAFLEDRTTSCTRPFLLAQDCTTMPSLSLQMYTSFSIFSDKTENTTVAVDVTSIVLQALDGTRTLLNTTDGSSFGPMLGENDSVCNNVVLQASYIITYGETGTIVSTAASLVLGAVDGSMLPIQQEFGVVFVQESAAPAVLPSSGNPGYVVGLPLVAGSRMADGIVRSADRNGGLTLLRSGAQQDCLGAIGPRVPVLFGVNMVSGCTLRFEESANCSLVSELILRVLRGTDFPGYVASFGNSPANAVMDWVQIKSQTTSTDTSCSVPLSLDLEVKWTKYGSLVNPQAQIVNVTEVIQTNTSSLSSLSGGGGILFISTSVTFIDVSAAAQPGYRAAPTIDAKLPYDFFFPFV